MLLFPNAKINLGLSVIKKRPDNFHNIETVFYPMALTDILEFIPLPGVPKGYADMTLTGIRMDGDPATNLCVKAYKLLCHDFELPGISVHLHKIIPVGAGLGGGSSDAAFMLKGLNDQFDLKLDPDRLEDYAAHLGSDCAFFVRNQPVFAFEKGQKFSKISLALDDYYILLVYPGIHISTAQAYSRVKPARPELSPEKAIKLPVSEWKNTLVNDFEKSVFEICPQVKMVKEKLYEKGAVYASMSGSGSAVYGLFNHLPDIPDEFASFYTWRGSMRSRLQES